jgi:steroid delta-isomerase-like uncharacterized protein
MGIEENKEVIRQMYNLASKGKWDAIYELYSPDFVVHTGKREMTLEETKRFDDAVRTAFPDTKVTVHNMIGEGDKVAFQLTTEMTHTGTFMGAAPTGKQLTMNATYIVRIVDNTIAEWWGNNEFPLLIQQLGITLPGQ